MQIEKCEICSKTFVAEYGYSLAVNWLVTGHHLVRAFLCPTVPSGQHWGCSPEHAVLAATRCLNEHMHIQELLDRHQATEKPRYAPEHGMWAEPRGNDFHIIEITGGFL